MTSPLVGLRVLVVEDELLLALDLQAILEEAGCKVIGPAMRVDQALQRIAEEVIEAAVLDVNLGHETVFPVADALAERRLPFVFLSGYDRDTLPERFHDRPLLGKPYSISALLVLLQEPLRS